jgi:hypothetical protein
MSFNSPHESSESRHRRASAASRREESPQKSSRQRSKQMQTPAETSTQRSASESIRQDDAAHVEQLLDDALAATFPCSDPISTLTPDVEAPPN